MSSKTIRTASTEVSRSEIVPKLRFAEFQGEGAWTTETLGSVARLSTEKVGDKPCIPMSITSGVGLVSQMEKFGRIIAGGSFVNYLQLRKGDFAYNKSATKEYPEGFIALYSGEELAAVPNSIFTCFRVNGDSPDPRYLNYLFHGNLHGRWLRKFIEVGARAHGSLSIADVDLLALPVPLPSGKTSRREQQKIAECLCSVDEMIGAQGRQLDALKTHRKGLMQQLFPCEGETQPRLRFPDFRGSREWKVEPFNAIYDFKPTNTYSRVQLNYETGLAKNIHYGDIHTKFPTSFRVAAELVPFVNASESLSNVKRDAYCQESDMVFADSSEDLTDVGKSIELVDLNGEKVLSGSHTILARQKRKLFVVGFAGHLFKGRGIRAQIEKEAQGTKVMAISPSRLAGTKVSFPPHLGEQQLIASCLSTLDDLIAAENQKLETLKTHKSGLMQQLFPSEEDVGA